MTIISCLCSRRQRTRNRHRNMRLSRPRDNWPVFSRTGLCCGYLSWLFREFPLTWKVREHRGILLVVREKIARIIGLSKYCYNIWIGFLLLISLSFNGNGLHIHVSVTSAMNPTKNYLKSLLSSLRRLWSIL